MVLPQGVWTPALNIAALLKTIQLLMNAPNPDDGLVVDIVRRCRTALLTTHSLTPLTHLADLLFLQTEQFKRDYASFEATAKAWTKKHAVSDAVPSMLAGVGSSVTSDVRGVAVAAAAAHAASPKAGAKEKARNAFDDDDSGGGDDNDRVAAASDDEDDAEKHVDKKQRA